MQILSVTLKNFKTHQDRHFTFSAGTNAICGENGAGKTSILEAIAWTLFNYQGSYSKEDLIHNGSGSAEVTVEFISSQDNRTYAVKRHTGKGYTLFDPQLNARLPYTRIKDEVLPWLRDHLGVAPGTDLGELFARTVGVPQGTFTADFLQSPETRKAVFDKVLKVDEYKTVHRDLNSLRRYAEAQIEAVERDLANYEERLATWDNLSVRHQQLQTTLADNTAQLHALTQELAALSQEQASLQAQAETIRQFQEQQQQQYSQIEGKQQAIALLQQNLQQAEHAVQVCTESRDAYLQYQAADQQLQALAQQQLQRQSLQRRQQQLQKTLANRAVDLTRLQVQLETLQTTAQEIADLQPKIQAQQALEAQTQALRQQQQRLAQARGELQATAKQVQQLRSQIGQLSQERDRLQTLAAQLGEGAPLEQQRDRLQQQLSRVEAARQFEAELRQLIANGESNRDRYQQQATVALQFLADMQKTTPATAAIAAIKAALETGVAVNQSALAQVQQILDDVLAQTDSAQLRTQLAALQPKLQQDAQQRAETAMLPERQQQLVALQHQEGELGQGLKTLQQQLTDGAELGRQLQEAETALAQLGDPRRRCAVLSQSQQQEPALKKRYADMQRAQVGIQKQLDELDKQLQTYQALEEEMTAHTEAKVSHQAGYLQYLQYERVAQGGDGIAAALTEAEAQLAQLRTAQQQVQGDLATATAAFDRHRLAQLNTVCQDLQSQRDRLAGSLPQQQQLLAELTRQLDSLKTLAAKRDAALVDRKRRDRIKRFINFARRAYKEAGPRITERYVQQVGREADRLFRELLNRQNVALIWTRDYEIRVQEGPHTRRFINLSGGEQMCAALAVRLALLKVLADIDIAFFDEPTTNMDRSRRESLAEAIGRIKTFKQLFVISHDDTFEQVTENVIVVERSP